MIAFDPLRRGSALVLIPLLLAGCVSTRTAGHRDIDGEVGGVQVTVFADDDDREAGVVGPRFVQGDLERREGGRWVPVFKALSPTWTVVDLPPGKYRVRFSARLDEQGNAVALEDEGRVFRVREGEVTEVETTIEHFPTGLVVAGIVTAVVAAVILDELLDDLDLPTPPLPSPVLADAVFHLTIDLAAFHAEAPGRPDLGPAVTSHFPEQGALVAARTVRVVFSFSEPLNPRDVEADAITVVAEKAGLVAGAVAYDPERWWLTWDAASDLPRDDVFHVTLAADAFEDLGGNEMPAPVTFTFRTAQ
jgi:hypothetical protein